MRILIVSHPPLEAESGAAQIALNLAAALRERGHDALAWSPEPLHSTARWWDLWLRRREAIEHFASAHGPFDVIDVPALSASRRLAGCGYLVARSFQPELLYLADSLRQQWFGPRPSLRAPVHTVHACALTGSILAGWRRADLILCLGLLEREWMRRRFPQWAGKLDCYSCAPARPDRAALAEVRRVRTDGARRATRWIWIGRWASHKGTARLLAWIGERSSSHLDDSFTIAGCGRAAAEDWGAGWRRDLRESGRVRLVDSFTRRELPGLLAAHDAGLFTSQVEGWGLCLNEMLEAGLPVYATEAGAVADLRPYFPRALRPFPPPPGPIATAGDDAAATGYLERFDWAGIAAAYESQILAGIRAHPAPAAEIPGISEGRP